ncbi:MAG: homoserine kinase [Dictyoglomus sp.]
MRYLIKVPATSANIGPGFDTLAIAWNLFLKITVDTNTEGRKIFNRNREEIQKNDLFIQSLEYTLKYFQIEKTSFIIELVSDIPIGKGLGSSAAAIVGGICTGEIIAGKTLSNYEKLKLALNFEKHIDNLSACIDGGVVICMNNNKELIYEKLPIDYDLWGLIYIPPYNLPTEKARKILPKKYDKEKIVFNLQKLSFLLTGLLKKDERLLNLGLDDCIHQPYRFRLIKEFTIIYEEMKNLNKKLVLSGAGPSLLSLFFSYEEALETLDKLKNNLREKVNGEFIILKINYQGPIIKKL